MLLGDVVDQLHDGDGLAHTGAAKQSDLAAARVGADQVDDLDAGFENLDLDCLLIESGGVAMDGHTGALDRAVFIDGFAGDVHQASEGAGPNRDRNRTPGISRHHPAHESIVESIAIQRTVFSPRCCATSSTRLPGLSPRAGLVTRSAFRMAGKEPLLNWTSTTLPRT